MASSWREEDERVPSTWRMKQDVCVKRRQVSRAPCSKTVVGGGESKLRINGFGLLKSARNADFCHKLSGFANFVYLNSRILDQL